LTVYFGLLTILGVILIQVSPIVGEIVAGAPLAGPDGGLRDLLADAGPEREAFLLFDLRMFIVMTGTLLITIPFSWGYMAVRERAGYEQSVVQTLVILPVVVAAIMMVIQNSLALAFALGGVAAAVRFRNTLKDVADATYVFLAIGLGISAGSGTLSASLVMAAMFTYVSVLLWRCNFGWCSTEAAQAGVTAVDADVTPAARVRGELIVDVRDDESRTAVERVISESTRRWKLRRTSQLESGATQLHYALQLKRSASSDTIIDALQAVAAAGVGAPTFQARASSTK